MGQKSCDRVGHIADIKFSLRLAVNSLEYKLSTFESTTAGEAPESKDIWSPHLVSAASKYWHTKKVVNCFPAKSGHFALLNEILSLIRFNGRNSNGQYATKDKFKVLLFGCLLNRFSVNFNIQDHLLMQCHWNYYDLHLHQRQDILVSVFVVIKIINFRFQAPHFLSGLKACSFQFGIKGST